MKRIISIFVGLTLTVFLAACSSEEISPSGSGQSVPKDAEDYYNRGVAYGHRGEYDRAIADYDRAIKINPRDAKAYNNRGLAYARKGQYDRAISDFTRAIEINPRYAEAHFFKARACEKEGRTKEAIEAYKGFIQCAPSQYARQIEHAKERMRELEE